MIGYLIRRLTGAALVLLVLSAIVYGLFYALPTDPARLACGKLCPPEQLAIVRHDMGLDKSLVNRYLSFLHGIFFGADYSFGPDIRRCPAPCFGYSYETKEAVSSLLANRLPVSASIAVGAMVLAFVLGVSGGLLTALGRFRWLDRALNGFILVGYATPVFLVALVLLVVFSQKLQWLPYPTYVPLTEDPVEWARNLLLPWIALALILAGTYARMTRTQTLETLSEDHIRTARAYGLSSGRIVARHVLRGALTPLTTIVAIDFAGVMSSAVLTETMFGLFGVGKTLVDAVNQTDLPVVVGVTLAAGAVFVLANAVADILYAAIDPRVELR